MHIYIYSSCRSQMPGRFLCTGCMSAPEVSVYASFRHRTCSKPPCSCKATCSLGRLEDVEMAYLVGGDWNMTFIFPYIGDNNLK